MPGSGARDNVVGKTLYRPRHRTRDMRSPWGAPIDLGMTDLIQACWSAGLRTHNCCEGYDADLRPPWESRPETPYTKGTYSPTQDLAYIAFASDMEAALFAAVAGPFARGNPARQARGWRGQAWTDWHLEGSAVRFPHGDITIALAALRRRISDVRRIQSAWADVPASPPRDLRTCAACGGPLGPLRSDARYCSRACQARAARRRARKPTEGAQAHDPAAIGQDATQGARRP